MMLEGVVFDGVGVQTAAAGATSASAPRKTGASAVLIGPKLDLSAAIKTK